MQRNCNIETRYGRFFRSHRALLNRYRALLRKYTALFAYISLTSETSDKSVPRVHERKQNCQVSFAEYRLFYRTLLQKRPIISRSLLLEATPSLKVERICTHRMFVHRIIAIYFLERALYLFKRAL